VSDLDLIATAASGGTVAFERLYERYERRVYNYVRTFLRQPSVAEEVVIDTMMAVWHGARGFGGSSRVSTWILGIARHKALDAARKVGRSGVEVPLEDASEVVDQASGPADATDSVFRSKLVRRAIAELSVDHQEILRLAFFEELPYEEIASVLSIPDNTVKTRVFYAKQQLRRLLDARELESAE
jgi:RNA polymerase sigma-70 factor (ECF subfamily)